MEQLVQKYREEKDVPADKPIHVSFDGEELASDETLVDLDVEDGDQFDVQF